MMKDRGKRAANGMEWKELRNERGLKINNGEQRKGMQGSIAWDKDRKEKERTQRKQTTQKIESRESNTYGIVKKGDP